VGWLHARDKKHVKFLFKNLNVTVHIKKLTGRGKGDNKSRLNDVGWKVRTKGSFL
jgi:hypothetical protein